MPRKEINRATNFIIEEESWSVVEYDHTSVPGVIYLSLTEGKINSIYDDIENNVADLDKLAKYGLLLPKEPQIFSVGEKFIPTFTFIKNGKPVDSDTEYCYISLSKEIVKVEDNKLLAKQEGVATIGIYIKDYPESQQQLTVYINNDEQVISGYIIGSDTIKLDREENYRFMLNNNIPAAAIFKLLPENNEYASIKENNDTSCIVKANAKNKLGTVTLCATYAGVEYSKNITIIPLW